MKIIQIIPAPANLFYAFDKSEASPAICLALVEAASGDREVRAMGLTNGEFIEDVQEAGALLLNEWHTEDGQ